ncbi:MAG: GTPase [Deltaproteobacteria bacterium]|nr:GTPase [Deltaproteobacteria bacterium]
MSNFNCIIMGAAGRDFHDFLTFFQKNPQFRVRCFTATQIPFIEQRTFPASLAGPGYEEDIPIFSETRLEELIQRYKADFVFFSYSDLSHREVMHRASRVQAAGASYVLLGPQHTELVSTKPVLSVTAVRTGAGKSPISQALTKHLSRRGIRVGVLRHPMPYGDLAKQAVQRFATEADLDRHECTVEEREEYEPYIERGLVIYAGVDYAKILAEAEKESDVILWDGGNNDTSFVRAGLRIVVADALRPGHELDYYPGETNFRRADILVINKVSQAPAEAVERVRNHALTEHPNAVLIESDLRLETPDEAMIRGKRVLVVEDGPTLTHGGMSFGAGVLAARTFGAKEIIDPRPHAVGTIAEAYAKFPHLGALLPALGYAEGQRQELRATIENAKPEVVIDASPARLGRLLDLDVPVARISYAYQQKSGPDLIELVDAFLAGQGVK